MNRHAADTATDETGHWPGPPPNLITLVLLAAVSPLAINLFVPSIPSIATDLREPYASVQLGLSLYLVMTALLQLVIGPLSDLYGRRPVIYAGLGLFLIGTVLCVVADSLEVFLIGRIFQSASATGMVLSRAIVRDVYPRHKAASAMGYMVMGMAVAPMIGPAIGGQIQEWFGWRMVFVALGIFGVVAIALALPTLPETNRFRGMPLRAQAESYRKLGKLPLFWFYAAAAGFSSAGFFGFLGGGPAVSNDYFHLSPSSFGLYFATGAFGYAIGNFITGRFTERRGLERMMLDGVIISFLGPVTVIVLSSAGIDHPLAFFGPLTLVGFGNGLTLPNAVTAAISLKPETAGASSGIIGALQVGIGAVASVLAGLIVDADPSPLPLSFFLATCGLLAILLTIKTVRMGRAR